MPTFTGTAGDDTLTGGEGDDAIDGAGGNDTLRGGRGVDRLTGGTGGDAFEFAVGDSIAGAMDAILDFQAGTDRLVLEDLRTPTELGVSVTLARTGDGGTLVFASHASGPQTVIGVTGTIQAGDVVSGQTPVRVYMLGSDGADILIGGAGADILNGGAGDDVLFGGTGDILRGGVGSDQFILQAGSYQFEDFSSGIDKIDLTATAPTRINVQIYDNDFCIIGAHGASDSVYIVAYASPTGPIQLSDFLLADRTNVSITVSGSAGANRLVGGLANDSLSGQGGDDTLIGGAGSDTLDGGTGADTFAFSAGDSTAAAMDSITSFSTGADRIVLEGTVTGVSLVRVDSFATLIYADHASGPQTVIRSNGRVQAGDVFGSNGQVLAANMVGSVGTDVLIGSGLADAIDGGAGDDTLRGGRGLDQLTGGLGADTFVFASGDSIGTAIDSIADFQTGLDRIVIEGAVTTLSNRLSLVRTNSGGTLIFANHTSGPQTVIGVNGTIGAGDIGGDNGMVLNAYMQGSDMADTLVGGSLDDLLWGLGGDDVLIGGDGNDDLSGGAGADTLTGGAGRDGFSFGTASDSTASAQDRITDFQTGTDSLFLTQLNASSISIAALADGSSVVFAETRSGAFQVLVQGSAVSAADITYGRNFPIYMFGSAANDTLIGSDRPDSIVGNGGDDIIQGGGGADALAGGAGRDVFRYRFFSDSNQSQGYDNLYDFTSGEDVIDVSRLSSIISNISIVRTDDGSSFVFALTGSPNSVFVTSAAGRIIQARDIVIGSVDDRVTMLGSRLADVLIGGSNQDAITGGAGDDIITGGGSRDALFGEGGADTFVYLAASDSVSIVGGADTIFGFVSGEDRIDLTRVRTGSADTFAIAYDSGSSFLFVDLGGNGSNDMLIQLAEATLVVSDIRWSAGAGGLEPAVKDAGPEVLPVSDEIDVAWAGLDTIDGGEMLFLADGGLASARGHDWYL